MFTLKGAGVGTGVAIGRAVVIDRSVFDVPSLEIATDDVDKEVTHLDQALKNTVEELAAVRSKLSEDTSGDIAAFLETHMMMAEDQTLREGVVNIIRENSCSAESALLHYRSQILEVFENVEDPYLRSRQDDVDQVIQQIYRQMMIARGQLATEVEGNLEGCVLVAHDLTPSDTVFFKDYNMGAFVTDLGSPISHVAILARSLQIPAIVGLHGAVHHIRHGDTLVVDSRNNEVIVNPTDDALLEFEKRQEDEELRHRLLLSLQHLSARTTDGHEITLLANVELPSDIEAAVNCGADGVGLYRTEYLFMNREEPPSEEEQTKAYIDAVKRLRSVTIRTLDLGADKQVDGGRQLGKRGKVVTNPALGIRAVRLCLRHQELFRPQLRAIFRASAYGTVQCMIPMISSIDEVNQVMTVIEEVKAELGQEGVPYDPNMQVGAMIEVPAAAIMADMFAQHLDFLSIGTNDLIQYTLAIDRVDDEVNYLYDPLHPSVLRLIQTTIEAGVKNGKSVSLCGEMAGETIYTRLLLGLGLTVFSMDSTTMPEVKQVIRNSDLSETRNMVNNIVFEANTESRRELLFRLNALS